MDVSLSVCLTMFKEQLYDDGDGKHEVHVNTMKGFWSLLRPCLRPHRGISQERLPYYLGFFEYLHNIIKRGQVALSALIGLLVAT